MENTKNKKIFKKRQNDVLYVFKNRSFKKKESKQLLEYIWFIFFKQVFCFKKTTRTKRTRLIINFFVMKNKKKHKKHHIQITRTIFKEHQNYISSVFKNKKTKHTLNFFIFICKSIVDFEVWVDVLLDAIIEDLN